MTSAVDQLIAAALQSDDANIRTLATAARAERKRGRGQPPKLSADDPEAMFIVFDGVYARHYTGEVMLWQGVDQYGKPVVDPEWPDGEPVAITQPMIETTDAIARELMDYAGCSINTAREFAREQIAKLAKSLEEDVSARGRINIGKSGRARLAELKAAKEKLTKKS